MKKYIKRIFDDVLDFSLRSKGAVVIVGPKWCGKSTTASRFAKTIIDLMPLETRNQYITFAKTAPSEFLNIGEKPILIDEWQHVSFIWDQIKDVNKKLTSYKAIKQLEIKKEEFEKTSTMKIKRYKENII